MLAGLITLKRQPTQSIHARLSSPLQSSIHSFLTVSTPEHDESDSSYIHAFIMFDFCNPFYIDYRKGATH